MAEELIYGNWSTGSANDFEQATSIAGQIIKTGLSELGIIDQNLISKDKIAATMEQILNEQKERVKKLLAPKAELIKLVTTNLLEKEKIPGAWLREQLKCA